MVKAEKNADGTYTVTVDQAQYKIQALTDLAKLLEDIGYFEKGKNANYGNGAENHR